MTGRREVVLWDVDGTLVDFAATAEEHMARVFKRAGISWDQVRIGSLLAAREEYQRTSGQWRTIEEERRGAGRLAAIMLRESSLAGDAGVVVRLTKALSEYYDRFKPLPGIHDLLAELHGLGVRQAVVSNWPPSLPAFLEHHGFSPYFEIVVGSGREGVSKPEPALFQVALQRLGVEPSRAIYVGDNPANDMAPARALGMLAIHFNPRGDHAEVDARDVARLRRLLLEALELMSR